MGEARGSGPQSLGMQLAIQYGCMALWIFLSASVILVNKYILSVAGFPYPIALTCIHMGFGSVLAFVIVKLGLAEATPISADMYISSILPIGLLFAGTLWTSNSAYLYLSVSFIQILKATTPLVVFVVGCGFGTEKFTLNSLANMVVVGVGIAIASYGELLFVVIGVVLQCSSILCESTRLTLVQVLLQKRGVKLNPVSTLYHIAPACFVFLFLPFTYIELPKIVSDPDVNIDVPLLFGSAGIAFALNMSVFLLIGKTSALTMNIAGVVKDWLLIGLSVAIFGNAVTPIQLFGYGISFLGVCYYNYQKISAMKTSSAPSSRASDKEHAPSGNGEERVEERDNLLSKNDRGEK
uniref:Sugar phosphate transporter domain-containing protein n=1 Tax=Chlamydomonas euryale TaxID=1486919 RepID=A0A7R9VSQ7_9CHLO|mmetsp:Transcript_43858/g.131474  ORF Transcript_43858/g.131474 Transcript_43858/m.131474 type:complete len:352 (+) Transcript_43858:112-1167(+)